MSTHSLVVKAYRPWRYRLAIALLLALAIAAVAYAYNRGLTDGGYFHGEVRSEREQMEAQLAAAEETERQLRERVAILERAQEVDQAARENLRRDVVDLQDEIQGLREELAFYRGIVSPEEGQRGLQLQDFSLVPGDGPGEYEYSLMLIQAMTHDRRVEGRVELRVHGRLNGEPHALALDEVSDREELAFSFRYFEGMDGVLRLPDGFEPREIALRIVPSGRNRSPLEETIAWPLEE